MLNHTSSFSFVLYIFHLDPFDALFSQFRPEAAYMALEPKTVNAKAKTQAMGMELRQLVLRVDPPKPKGFFRLPVELRTHIYRYCLLELPRWEKRHGAACQHAPRDYMSLERPPFTFSTDTSMGLVKNGRLGLVLASCDCAKRKGLSLLRLNRQIHREAAAIFWTGNVFCWQRPVTFVKNISAGVRDEYRRLIRHISIVSDAWENDCRFPRIVWDTVRPYDRFWAAVHKCTGLHSLELRPEYVTWYHEPVCTLRRHCPQLESFRLVKLHLYDLIYEDDGGGAYLCPPEKRRLLWFKTAWPVDLGRITDRESCRETTRDFYTNFLVHARFAIETHLLGRPANQFGLNVCAAYPYRVPSLDDTSGSQSIQLRDGSKCDIHVFGLPPQQGDAAAPRQRAHVRRSDAEEAGEADTSRRETEGEDCRDPPGQEGVKAGKGLRKAGQGNRQQAEASGG